MSDFIQKSKVKEILEDYYGIHYQNLIAAEKFEDDYDARSSKRILHLIKTIAADLNIKLNLEDKPFRKNLGFFFGRKKKVVTNDLP